MMFFPLLLCSLFSSVVLALPVSLANRDVWVPPITSPTSESVWVVGGKYNVTWDTSTKPSQVTNPIGEIYLRHGNATQNSPIAQGFPLSAGSFEVTVPANTVPGDDWIVVLFGDSGNWSPPFEIKAAST